MNVDPNNLYPDPSWMSVFGAPKKAAVVYFPKEYIRAQRAGRRGTKPPPENVTSRRADSLRSNLDKLKQDLAAYPPYEYLDAAISYNPYTGDMLWKTRPREHFRTDRGWKLTNSRFADEPVGVRYPNQQTWVSLDKVSYKADTIAHILMGREPPLWVIHKDGDASNIKWENMVGVYEEDL